MGFFRPFPLNISKHSNILNAYYVIFLLYSLPDLILITTLGDSHFYYPLFMDEVAETGEIK